MNTTRWRASYSICKPSDHMFVIDLRPNPWFFDLIDTNTEKRFQASSADYLADWRSATLIGSLSYEAASWISPISQEGSISPEAPFPFSTPKPRSQHLQSAAMPCERSKRGCPSIVSRCRPERPRRSLCDLPSARTPLLDAVHIVMDADEQLGQPIVSNGLPLTKIHHAAFDAHLIGIDPDFRIHVSDRLLEIHDRPFLELGPKESSGR